MSSDKKEFLGDYFNLSVPNDLRLLYEAYIKKYKNLGFKNVSSFMIKILQDKAQDLIKDNPELKQIKKIIIKTGTYLLQEDGSYKKID